MAYILSGSKLLRYIDIGLNMKQRIYTIYTFVIAIVFWFFDSVIHFLKSGEAKFELIPHDSHELLIHLVIAILIIFTGVLADYFTKIIIKKEKELEAANIYESTLSASQHILNNFLHKMPLFIIEAKRCNDFNPKYIKHFEQAINDATDLVQQLSEVKTVTGENIKASVDPESIAKLQRNNEY